MYFVYPALLLLAVHGTQVPGRRAGWLGLQRLAGAALVLARPEAAHSLWFISSAYPNQQAYFSFLPAATAERLLERDYWGLSYRYGLEWLLRHDPSPVITVTGPQPELIYFN